MLNNPLIFGILSASIITILYTIIIYKLNNNINNNINNNTSEKHVNNSIILFTVSLIVVAIIHLFITSNNVEEIEKLSELTLKNEISNNMMTGQPNF